MVLQTHKTRYQKKKLQGYLFWLYHSGCRVYAFVKMNRTLKWVNLIVCKLYLNKVVKKKKKVNLGCVLNPGGLQRGHFQKHLVSKPLGSPQGNAENMKDALNLCQHKKVLIVEKDWDFSSWTGCCSTFITCSAFITLLICTMGIVISYPPTSHVCNKD